MSGVRRGGSRGEGVRDGRKGGSARAGLGGFGLGAAVSGGGGGGGMAPRFPSAAAMAAAGGRVLDFRRRGAPPRRKRRSLLLTLAKPLAVALSAVALPVGLCGWVLTSRRFQLREVVVERTHRVSPAWVRWALNPLAGQNLVRLSLADAAGRLERNPWIGAADISKQLPDRLRVAVTERRPAVLLAGGGALFFADAGGRPIAPVGSPAEEERARRAGLLVVAFEQSVASAMAPGPAPAPGSPAVPGAQLSSGISGALAVAEELRRARPPWAAVLSRIDVLGEEDFRLHTAALPCPLLVTSGHVAAHLRSLEELLPRLAQHYQGLAGIDLRFTRRIVVQPLLSPAPERGSKD
jgi:hypothetical protein